MTHNQTILTTTNSNQISHSFWRRHRNNCCHLKSKSIFNYDNHSISFLASLSVLLTIFTYFNILLINVVHTYNLDTQKALIKFGPKGSYFGYSIAQHAIFDQDNINSTFRSYVIVGAPKADSSRAPALIGVVKPGAIYRCDFSLSKACHLIDIDLLTTATNQQFGLYNLDSSSSSTTNSADNNAANDNTAGAAATLPINKVTASSMDSTIQRDNQWLGVSVKSQGANGYALACAHRYVLKGYNYRWGQGICYSLTKNLTLHKTWQPCLNRPVNSAHEEYGFCQAGTSSDISESSDIVLGSPGPYTWRGSVFTNSISFTPKDDRTWYMAPVTDEESKVDKYSYLGMSVISGKYFNKQLYYVSGAPRSKEVGQVLFMTKQNSPNGRRSGESTFRTDQILDGEQIASSFGYTLTKIDFNGDSLPDLVVSAPFYYTKTEGGAVYMYANDGKAVIPAGKLTGKPESRFGFALANCGDLNHDKYEDLAIGAPYEAQGGVVYIHFGSANGIKSSPSQVIKASSIGSNLQTFGYSLSGGMDMDLNGYPDLAVGSYADDSVYIILARPIIEISTKIEGNLTKIDPNRTTCDGEKNQLPCFKFNTCFELDPAKIGEYSDSMKLKYRIEAETFTGQTKYSRVKFQESENTETPHIVEKEILIDDYYRGMKLKRCNAQRVYIKDRSDIHTPIKFKLTYYLVPPTDKSSSQPVLASNRYSSIATSNQLISSYSLSSSSSSSSSSPSLLSLSLANSDKRSSSSSGPLIKDTDSTAGLTPPFPILNQEEAQRIFSAHFLKDCGANDICESHLDVDGQIQLPKETLGLNEPGYPSDKQINITIRAANSHEPAYESKLFVTHPASLIYSGFKPIKQVAVTECTSIDKGLVKCDLGNPMPKGTTKLLMIFNTLNQAGTFDFNLMVNTTSQNSKDAKTSFDLSGTIRKKVEPQIIPRPPPNYPGAPTAEPPTWLILLAILLGIILFSALFYCLYVHGFFERSKAPYTPADTEERFN